MIFMPVAEKRYRHPYDMPRYRQMWDANSYKANRAFYAINVLRKRDNEFGLKFGEIQRMHAAGKISGERANELVSAEIGGALRRMATVRR